MAVAGAMSGLAGEVSGQTDVEHDEIEKVAEVKQAELTPDMEPLLSGLSSIQGRKHKMLATQATVRPSGVNISAADQTQKTRHLLTFVGLVLS